MTEIQGLLIENEIISPYFKNEIEYNEKQSL